VSKAVNRRPKTPTSFSLLSEILLTSHKLYTCTDVSTSSCLAHLWENIAVSLCYRRSANIYRDVYKDAHTPTEHKICHSVCYQAILILFLRHTTLQWLYNQSFLFSVQSTLFRNFQHSAKFQNEVVPCACTESVFIFIVLLVLVPLPLQFVLYRTQCKVQTYNTGVQLIKISSFQGNQMLIAVLTSAPHWTPFRVNNENNN
jgi:hypothetical protein